MRKPTNQDTGRDSNGRFAEGNQAAHGNPFHRRMAEMRQAMIEAVTIEELRDIIKQVVVKARLGDLTAAKLVLGYVVGKPVAPANPDRNDLDEWELNRQRPATSEVAELTVKGCAPGFANAAVFGIDGAMQIECQRMFDAAEKADAPADGVLTAKAPAKSVGRRQGAGGRKTKGRAPEHDAAELSILGNGNGNGHAEPQGMETLMRNLGRLIRPTGNGGFNGDGERGV